MGLDLERIIQYIEKGDQDRVQVELNRYNTQYAECFFFDVEERERRKQRQLEEFRKNKVRMCVPGSDSDSSDEEEKESDLILRKIMAAALLQFIHRRLQPCVLRVCLCTLRILSRDRYALEPLVTDDALLTLAHLGGISSLPAQQRPIDEDDEGNGGSCAYPHNQTSSRNGPRVCEVVVVDNNNPVNAAGATSGGHSSLATTLTSGNYYSCDQRGEGSHGGGWWGLLSRGKKDAREEKREEEEKEEDGEVCRKEALKVLCNVIYNSNRAQESASTLRFLPGLINRLKLGIESRVTSTGQFYELRLLFLLTALRPELRQQLQQDRGLSMLTSVLEQCLDAWWGEGYEVLTDQEAPPISKEVTQRAIEILKTLFTITSRLHRLEPDEEEAAQYRQLVAVLRHCLQLSCEGEDLSDDFKGHTVNMLSVVPLTCLDVLVSVRLPEGCREWEGVNMDFVHTMLLFMERRMDRGQKLKEKLIPVLNLMTESCRAHSETRHYLRHQILPPLRDVSLRPEEGTTLRARLVRLMTNVDTEVKHCAAELLFVLCKENVRRFIKYTGYGNAAGLLAARGLLAGGPRRVATLHSQYSSDSDSDTEEYREAKDRINMVTGRVEAEQPDPMEGMTDEEKELEALNLIDMFTRLSSNRIIQPVVMTDDGRLAPICGQMRGCTLQQEEEEDNEEEDEEWWESVDDMDQ